MTTTSLETTALTQAARSAGRVLVAEDDEPLRRAYGRVLRAAGFSVDESADAESALDRLRRDHFDVVVSDINMPRLSGLELVRAVRETDFHLPIVLITGSPTLESATEAIDQGVLRYLLKPIDTTTLVETVTRAARLHELSRLTNGGLGATTFTSDHGGIEAAFARALAGIEMAYQPIVRVDDRSLIAVEALLRTSEPSMARPDRFFAVAEHLGQVRELGRAVRAAVAGASSQLPPEARLFVNLHPLELLDSSLYDPREPLSRIATRVTLEITERAALDNMSNLRARVVALRALGYQIAIDDMGAGYASLASFAQIEPDVAKVDMSLVRRIHLEPTMQNLVAAFLRMCTDLGIPVVFEGVESQAELETLRALGCELFQGFLFSRPGPLPPRITWG